MNNNKIVQRIDEEGKVLFIVRADANDIVIDKCGKCIIATPYWLITFKKGDYIISKSTWINPYDGLTVI